MEERNYEQRREKLLELLESRRLKSLQNELEDMNEFDIAEFLTELGEEDKQKMATVFRLLSKGQGAEVFAELDAPEQQEIISSITDKELGEIIEDMYVDDAVDMMEELPANIVKRVMRTATPETRALINQYLKYPENSAGSIMTAEFVDLKKYMNVRESIARIRRVGEDKETIYVCYVTNAHRRLEGVVTVKDLLLHDDEAVIEDIMDTQRHLRAHDGRPQRGRRAHLGLRPAGHTRRGQGGPPRRHSHGRRRHRRPRGGGHGGLRPHEPASRPRTRRTPARACSSSGSGAYPG